MYDVTVLIPVLGRPERVAPLLRSLEASEGSLRLRPFFLCSPGDDDEISAVKAAGSLRALTMVVPWEAGPGDYARKMNVGFAFGAGYSEWVFLAADDLSFHKGWATEALKEHDRTGACVIGTNDLGNSRTISGDHSTHSLVHRDYAECGVIDDHTRLMYEGYDHNFVDTEFIQTAMWRGTFVHAKRSVVEHLHPDWGKGTTDKTYEKGRRRFEQDRRLFHQRSRLWGANDHNRRRRTR